MFLCPCTIIFTTKHLFYKTGNVQSYFKKFVGPKAVWWWSIGKWHLTHWRKAAQAGFGRVKSSCSCRIPSSWFPLHFYYYNFCMTSWTSRNLPILKAKGKVASCSQRGNPPPPSSTMPHKNIRSQIKTEWLESSKTTSFASVHLLLKIAFNLL